MKFVLLAIALLFSSEVMAEGGMIPFDSEPGEIGGKGHWYALRTMKGADYWADPARITDVLRDENGDYSVAGEPPLSVSILLHEDFYRDDEPWRRGIDWLRQAEQIFRNSGVPIRFVIEHIEIVTGLPDTVESVLNEVRYRAGRTADRVGADLTIVLIPTNPNDPYCGVAELPRTYTDLTVSVSACSPKILAHEMGHQFGLKHSFNTPNLEYNRGYCIRPEGGTDTECELGTIMSYADERAPFFSNANAQYGNNVLGNETSDAVRHLERVKTGRALTHELREGNAAKFDEVLEIVYD